jgi:hypothetical protein
MTEIWRRAKIKVRETWGKKGQQKTGEKIGGGGERAKGVCRGRNKESERRHHVGRTSGFDNCDFGF